MLTSFKKEIMNTHNLREDTNDAEKSVAAFPSERALIDYFLSFLRSDSTPWGKLNMKTEFSYQRGCADIVAVTESGDIIAFEAKLSRWRDATHQAYRNTCFAHESYVVLPEAIAESARVHDHEFDRRGVGLCAIIDGSIDIIKPAKRGQPLQEWLSRNALNEIRG